MANVIKPKRTTVAGRVPTTANIAVGEIALNMADSILYFRDTSDNIKSVSSGLATVGTAGTYTKVTTDVFGRVTAGTTLIASDVPTLNQNTTGSSGSCTGNAATATNVAWSGVTSKPTTLSGYGITDSVKNFGTVTINPAGFNTTCTTAQFVSWLTTLGAFSFTMSVMKCSWDYAGNNDITDTGFGTLDLAGCIVETFTDGSQYIIRVTSPSTGAGAGGIHEYINHGSTYSPGWRRVYTSSLNGNISGSSGSCSGNAATATNVAWSGVTSKPTTVSGYGITDRVIRWVNSSAVEIYDLGRTIRRPLGADTNGWDSQAYTTEAYAGDVCLSFKMSEIDSADANHAMIGFNTDPATDANYSSIDYSWYVDNGNMGCYESGSGIGNIGTWNTNSIFSIERIGTTLRYLQDGIVKRTVTGVTTSPFYVDSSFHSNIEIRDISITPAFMNAGNVGSYAPTLTGTGASGTWGINVTGNAATATKLATARTINGVSFDGTANITITASESTTITEW